MTRLALWSLAIALGLAGWTAIVELLGPWPVLALAYLYLLAFASVACFHGWTMFVRWLDRRRRP